MSRLSEMIARLCPNGVEYRKLGEVVEKVSTINWRLSGAQVFQYIDLSSVAIESHAITTTTTITAENAPSRAQQVVRENDVLFGTTRPMLRRYCKVPETFHGQICSTGFCVLRASDKVLPGWIEHNISSTDFFDYVEKHQKGASYPAISDSSVLNFSIPLPPLPVQREIVQILDNFANLTAELTAELAKRKKQYEHYRDMLLNFEGGGQI